jgi:2-furoyl-CoA dehydrogenase large subunit
MTSGSTTSTSGAVNRGSGAHEPSYTGRAVRRFEDADLLRGHGRFGDDLPVRPDTLHAAILRSPHAHAEILSVDVAGALAVPGVDCVVTSEDARRWTRPFAVAVKTAMEQWCLAIDRVRYVGEPVAVVLARNRDTAEDALEQIAVEYRSLPPIVDPEAAAWPDAPLLHPAVGSNVISERAFRYGDPETAFAEAEHRISITTRYPRNSATPIECFVVIAEYSPGEEAYEVVANFQGPFAMHPVMAMALGVSGNRLRLRTPAHSGGSFGVKHAVFLTLGAAPAFSVTIPRRPRGTVAAPV